MALEHFKTQVLLLHSEQSALDVMSSGFDDRYALHFAQSGLEALDALGMTPINVIISAQQLPGMTGLDALREAQRRSPDTIGILLAGDVNEDIEALVGDQELFQIVRGEIDPQQIRKLVDSATRKVRLSAIGESANDNAANVDQPGEHIVMETTSRGDNIVHQATDTIKPIESVDLSLVPNYGTQQIDLLILTRDEEFLSTIRESARGLHNVRHATDIKQASQFVTKYNIGVLVTDSAIVGADVYKLTSQLRAKVPRLVAVVAGRRDDGEMLMDLINQGQVYRFLLKPISAGRARLAIEASVKQHLEAPDEAFKIVPNITLRPAPVAKPKQPKPKKSPRKPTVIPAIIRLSGVTFRLLIKAGTMAAKALSLIAMWMLQALTLLAAALKKLFQMARSKPKAALLGTSSILVIATAGWLWNNWQTLIPDSKPVPPAASQSVDVKINNTTRSSDEVVDSIGMGQVAGSEPQSPAARADTETQLTAPQSEAPVQAELPIQESAPGIPANAAQTIASGEEFTISPDNALPENAIGQLLAQANQRLAENKLIAPHADNARHYFEQALEEDQSNAAAKQGLIMVGELLITAANTAIDADRLADANELLAEARQTATANNRLVETEQKLSDAWEVRFAATDAQKSATQSPSIAETDNSPTDTNSPLNEATSNEGIDEAGSAAGAGDTAPNTVESRIADYQAQLEEVQLRFTNAHPDVIALRETIEKLQQQNGNIVAEDDTFVAVAEVDDQLGESPMVVVDELPAPVTGTDSVDAVDDTLQGTENPTPADKSGAATINLSSTSAENNLIVQSSPLLAPTESADTNQITPEPGAKTANVAEPDTTRTSDQSPETPFVASTDLVRTQYKAPAYPRGALRRSITGWVELAFVVNETGGVEEISILNAEPSSIFNDAATKSLSQWQFEPIVKNGQALKIRSTIRMAFAFQ